MSKLNFYVKRSYLVRNLSSIIPQVVYIINGNSLLIKIQKLIFFLNFLKLNAMNHKFLRK